MESASFFVNEGGTKVFLCKTIYILMTYEGVGVYLKYCKNKYINITVTIRSYYLLQILHTLPVISNSNDAEKYGYF